MTKIVTSGTFNKKDSVTPSKAVAAPAAPIRTVLRDIITDDPLIKLEDVEGAKKITLNGLATTSQLLPNGDVGLGSIFRETQSSVYVTWELPNTVSGGAVTRFQDLDAPKPAAGIFLQAQDAFPGHLTGFSGGSIEFTPGAPDELGVGSPGLIIFDNFCGASSHGDQAVAHVQKDNLGIAADTGFVGGADLGGVDHWRWNGAIASGPRARGIGYRFGLGAGFVVNTELASAASSYVQFELPANSTYGFRIVFSGDVALAVRDDIIELGAAVPLTWESGNGLIKVTSGSMLVVQEGVVNVAYLYDTANQGIMEFPGSAGGKVLASAGDLTLAAKNVTIVTLTDSVSTEKTITANGSFTLINASTFLGIRNTFGYVYISSGPSNPIYLAPGNGAIQLRDGTDTTRSTLTMSASSSKLDALSGTTLELSYSGTTRVKVGATGIGLFGHAETGQAADMGVSDTGSIPNPADAPATADALRDDLVANVLPAIRSKLNALRDMARNLGAMA